MTENKKHKLFPNEIIEFDEFSVNSRQYSTFEVRYPTFSELVAHHDILEKSGSYEGYKALAELTKLCVVNLKHKSDFGAFPAPVTNTLMAAVGERLA